MKISKHKIKCLLFPKYREATEKAAYWSGLMATSKSIMADYK